MKKSLQRGFTLIELVVVITILGILAAFAVPRFMGLEQQARVSTMSSLAGSVKSAAAMANATWLASGSPASITVNGATVAMSFGYPTKASLPLTMNLAATDFAYATGTGVYTKVGAPTTCTITYTAAVNATTPATVSAPPVASKC
jgi:MSHA pilin protein MshA